jgi:protein-S-isoprenylcysteine O-methyltransferase Ste14
MKRQPFRLLARWATITASLATLLFLAAGTTHIPSIRRYLVVNSALLLVTMLAVDPRLAEERAHPANGGSDHLRLAAGFFFLLTLTVAAFTVGRLHFSFNVPTLLRDVALLAYALSGSLQTWAMTVNPFFSPVVRLHTERGHHVITNGPYRFVRHPGYLAMLISAPASALAIGSWIALVPAACFAITVFHRTRTEDEFLRKHLAGYADYANCVPGAFIPRPRQVLLNNERRVEDPQVLRRPDRSIEG